METKALLNDFINKVAGLFEVTLEEIRSKNKKRELSEIRSILSYELRNRGCTLTEIGEFLNLHYSTIIWNIKSYEGKITYDKIFRSKVLLVEKIKEKTMKILLPLDNSKLVVLNNSMQVLDKLSIEAQPRQFKSSISICMELRTELLQKAVKTRQKDKSFILKMPYYKADALLQFLKEFEIYFPDSFGSYESNAVLLMKNELHKQLL